MKDHSSFGKNRQQLVEALKHKGIEDQRVLNAIASVERHLFVPEHLQELAYLDEPLAIGRNQTISQPYTVALMTQMLEVEQGMKVLEVGTGSGYQAAILAQMGAEVYTIERIRELYENASQRLEKLGYNVHTFWGDGQQGLIQFAPFDRIIVTAGADDIPPILLEQLDVGGIMVIPLKWKYYLSMCKINKLPGGDLAIEKSGAFAFVPLLTGVTE